jgi:two-component system CheB/CheR fusion protein
MFMSSSSSSAMRKDRPLVVGLGGSAGGVEALQHFFEAVPDDSGLSFVVVMHLVPDETSHLSEVLRDHTSMPVTQVTGGTVIEPDHVYVTAPGRTLLIENTTLVPHKLEGPEERRSPIDRFFRSLAAASVEPMGVVVSGAGTDCSVGLRFITEAGGVIAAQDPSEAIHSSMPRSAIETSRVDFVLPVADLARRLSEQRVVLRRLHRLEAPDELDEDEEEILGSIFEEVRVETGHDFSEYKQSTMLRRVRRRLRVHQISSLEAYRDFLREHPSEAMALQKDLLISVTSFFRNPDAFEFLRENVVPDLLADRGPDDQIRAWSVGCATGEEAYSLAMLLLEHAESTSVRPEQIQVFASDLDGEALVIGREGRFPDASAADVPDRYLDRFFRRNGSEYVVRNAVRDRILFTPHNLLKDPPFSNLSLITCRNLLIYLRRDLQVSVFDLFSYALNDDGYLFLGSSESADVSDDSFRAVDKTHRLYQRREGARRVPEIPEMPLSSPTLDSQMPSRVEDATRPSEAVLHRRLLEAYAPPSAIVDEDYQFVHLSNAVGRYLQHPGGMPKANIVEVVRPELRVKLRTALRQAFDGAATVQTQAVTVAFNGESAPVHVVVRPARSLPNAEGLALVIFVESDEPSSAPAGEPDEATDEPENGRAQELRQELKQTKKELRATIEEYETSKQEMRAANEELRSMNEEYKSMTEELETSKEELQSVNEELKTVNHELEEKVEELRAVNSDLKNLMAATDIGTLFLDRELRIQRYTPRIEELFNIRQTDVDRPIDELTHHLDYDTLETDARDVLESLTPVEREVRSEEGEWFLVRFHPYRTVTDQIDGVVISFVEITRRVEAEQELRATNEALQERSEQVQALSEALTSAEETERKRLSQVLHDDLQQTIFAARMRVNHLIEARDFSGEASELATRTVELLDEGIETTRNLSSELDPPVGDQSLRDSLEWLTFQMQESYDFSVELEAKGTAKTTDKNLRHLLFRLVRELLFNVVKHAGVEEAALFLAEEPDRLRVVVEDEGVGFDPEEAVSGRSGLGLVSVHERIEMIGGTFEVDAAPGEGTRIAIEVPWKENGGEALPQT